MHRGWIAAVVTLFALGTPVFAQQQPLAPVRETGQTVQPVFEGWYRNPDGTYSLSFGYFNRNAREVLDIPIGRDNYFSPGDSARGQPTTFHPRRHWGAFVVTVPADFGDKKVVWTLNVRGETLSVPGSLKRGWELDALQGEAGSGNTPPVLMFTPGGTEGRGPGGIKGPALTGRVGEPVTLDVWARDDAKARSSIAGMVMAREPVTLTWLKHQGPGVVAFADATPALAPDGRASTTATFSAPGVYVLRVRANDASGVASAGHAQCCWTNGFITVTVTR